MMKLEYWEVTIDFFNENTNTDEDTITGKFNTEDKAKQFLQSILSKYKDTRKENELNFWDKNTILTENNIYISGIISNKIVYY